ncbi:MAG TPA: DUF308 domain-containing protein [Gemmatimonadales bacterium]|nr:DUF308 domain-containing protein [Gemmatimonadales bacterium]
MATDIIQSAYRRTSWALVLRGLFGIAIGALIVWRPLESVAVFAFVIAFWAIANGITQLVHGFELRPIFKRWWVLSVSGLIGVAFGVAALYYYPGLSLTFAVVWAAWWLFFTGALAIYGSIVERDIGAPWGWTLAFGILSTVCGVFALVKPPITLAALMGLIAGFALAGGVLLLIAAYKLSAAKTAVVSHLGEAVAH